MDPLVLVIGTILLVLGILAAIFIPLRRLAAQRVEAARQRFPNAKLIVPNANFFGQESRGVTQLRGNGTLVLTDSELYFERWVPRQEYRIPLKAVQAIETPEAHLGKTYFRPLLKVVYKDEAGSTDSIAWYVPDLAGTIRVLEEARNRNP